MTVTANADPPAEYAGIWIRSITATGKTYPAIIMDIPCNCCGCCIYYAPAAYVGSGDLSEWPRCVRCGERNGWLLLQEVM